jgi:2',3'-cyclic-nucleotide 2'-phosphodiesterase (5'-nucleotidase family)
LDGKGGHASRLDGGRGRFQRIQCGLLLFTALVVTPVSAGSTRLLILHTNDLHDHVRAGENGVGGLPYVSGYIKQVRAERPDVLVVDAGDVAEKGDLVAFRTHSVMTYEALRRIGYDGVTIGNHEHDEAGYDGLRRYEEALGQSLLCLNLLNADGTTAFEPSRLVDVNGVKIGLIGLIVPRKENGLDFAASGAALARESESLVAQGAELIVAICHERARHCADWSRAAPLVNVFVSGHSHEALHDPVVVPETGALIVQAGSYARWVGRLEIELDRKSRKIVGHHGRLVRMRHDQIPVDAEMLAWVEERELALAPEARELVLDNPAELDGFSVARLAAAGLRLAADVDVAFCHPYQIIRNVLPAGAVDVNALFKTGGQRGYENLVIELTGTEIDAYVNALQFIQREPPEWSGFRVRRETAPDGAEVYRSDLDPTRRYRVIMPKLEWETRFLRLAANVSERDPQQALARAARTVQPAPSPMTFTDALHAYIKRVLADGDTLAARAQLLVEQREDAVAR